MINLNNPVSASTQNVSPENHFSESLLDLLTEDERVKLAEITRPAQWEIIVSAILRGEVVPGFAWQNLPDLGANLDVHFGGVPPLSELLPSLPSRDECAQLKLDELEEHILNLCLAIGRRGHPEALDKATDLLLVHAESNHLEDFTSLEKRVLEDLVIPGTASAFALFPFLFATEDGKTRAMITMDLAVTLTSPDFPLQGIQRLLDLLLRSDEGLGNRILQGLALLGDRRVNSMLRDILPSLSTDNLIALASARSGQIFAATLEFKLEWLESLLREGSEWLSRSQRMLEAGILLNLVETALHCEEDLVHEIERELPLAGPESTGIRMIRSWTLEEYSERIMVRLAPLAERMTDPSFSQMVMRAWMSDRSQGNDMYLIHNMSRLEVAASTGNSEFLVPEISDKSLIFGKLWYVDEPNNWAYVPESWTWSAWRYYYARAHSTTWREFLARAGAYGEGILEWVNEFHADWFPVREFDEIDEFDGKAIQEREWDYNLGPMSVQEAMEAYLPEDILELAIVREQNVHGDGFVEFDGNDHGVILNRLKELGFTVREDQHLVSSASDSDGDSNPEEHAASLRELETV